MCQAHLASWHLAVAWRYPGRDPSTPPDLLFVTFHLQLSYLNRCQDAGQRLRDLRVAPRSPGLPRGAGPAPRLEAGAMNAQMQRRATAPAPSCAPPPTSVPRRHLLAPPGTAAAPPFLCLQCADLHAFFGHRHYAHISGIGKLIECEIECCAAAQNCCAHWGGARLRCQLWLAASPRERPPHLSGPRDHHRLHEIETRGSGSNPP